MTLIGARQMPLMRDPNDKRLRFCVACDMQVVHQDDVAAMPAPRAAATPAAVADVAPSMDETASEGGATAVDNLADFVRESLCVTLHSLACRMRDLNDELARIDTTRELPRFVALCEAVRQCSETMATFQNIL